MRLTDAAFGSDSDSDDEMEFGLFDGEVDSDESRGGNLRDDDDDVSDPVNVRFFNFGDCVSSGVIFYSCQTFLKQNLPDILNKTCKGHSFRY